MRGRARGGESRWGKHPDQVLACGLVGRQLIEHLRSARSRQRILPRRPPTERGSPGGAGQPPAAVRWSVPCARVRCRIPSTAPPDPPRRSGSAPGHGARTEPWSTPRPVPAAARHPLGWPAAGWAGSPPARRARGTADMRTGRLARCPTCRRIRRCSAGRSCGRSPR